MLLDQCPKGGYRGDQKLQALSQTDLNRAFDKTPWRHSETISS